MSEEKKPDVQKKPKDLKKIFFLLFFVINIAVMGGGTYLIYASTLGHSIKPLTETEILAELADKKFIPEGEPIMVQMDPFVVNLETPRYLLNVEISATLLDEKGYEELITKTPLARDAVMKVLHRVGFADIEPLQGKLFLKEKIMIALNEVLTDGIVQDVYFSQFVIQSR